MLYNWARKASPHTTDVNRDSGGICMCVSPEKIRGTYLLRACSIYAYPEKYVALLRACSIYA